MRLQDNRPDFLIIISDYALMKKGILKRDALFSGK